MALTTLNADHVGAAGGKFEPQRANNALLFITGLAEDPIKLALASFPVPKRTVGVAEVDYLNEKRKFAGRPTYDDLSVVFQDYVDSETATLLWRWAYTVHDPHSGRTGLASVYKKSGWVALYAPDGSTERRYDIEGMWPSAIDPGDIDMSSEDTLKLTVTITIDKAYPSEGIETVSMQIGKGIASLMDVVGAVHKLKNVLT